MQNTVQCLQGLGYQHISIIDIFLETKIDINCSSVVKVSVVRDKKYQRTGSLPKQKGITFTFQAPLILATV